MNIQFVDEPESDLVKRKSLYIDPESELSVTLSNIQDALELEGFTVDRSRYKYIRGRLCKFNIDLISEPDVNALMRRANSMKKLNLNLSKLKWEFTNRVFTLKIGKIQDKDLFVTVAFIAEVLGDIERDRIKDIKDRIIKGESKPVIQNIIPSSVTFSSPLISSSNNFSVSDVTFDEDDDEEEEEIIIPPPKPVIKPTPVSVKTKPVTTQAKMVSQPYNPNQANYQQPTQQNVKSQTTKQPIQQQPSIRPTLSRPNTTPIPTTIPQVQTKPVSVTKGIPMFKIRG